MTVFLLIGSVVVAFIAGYFLGREQMLGSLNKRIEESYLRGKAEVEAEKQKFAGDIREKLVDLKGSIKNTVTAYESTTRVLRSALAIPAESKERIGDEDTDPAADLALDFFSSVESAQPKLDAVTKTD